ncbi:MAG: 50S ribosomal protein L25/general stress protein Ctc [Thioalkalivibrionaceae bacterium]
MSQQFNIVANKREQQGTGASRRLRRAGRIPAIIYGGHAEPEKIDLDHNEVTKQLRNEAFYSQVLTLDVGGRIEKAVLRDIQRHPVKPIIMHMDFLRVSANETLRVSVPVHLLHEESCKGVKQGGGIINRQITEIEVECLPGDLPEFLEGDMADIDIGESLHMSQLRVPDGVKIVAFLHGEVHDHDQPVASVIKPRGESTATEGDETETGDAEGSEPSED